MSGRNATTASSAAAPVAASATTTKPSDSSSARAEARKTAWSSTIRTVGGTPDRLFSNALAHKKRHFQVFLDGPCWDRTSDLGIKSPLLYQLS
jgi:hypothetical protein